MPVRALLNPWGPQCDKIRPDDQFIYFGATVTWYSWWSYLNVSSSLNSNHPSRCLVMWVNHALLRYIRFNHNFIFTTETVALSSRINDIYSHSYLKRFFFPALLHSRHLSAHQGNTVPEERKKPNSALLFHDRVDYKLVNCTVLVQFSEIITAWLRRP